MSGSEATTRHGWTYPNAGDDADLDTYYAEIWEKLDLSAQYDQGTAVPADIAGDEGDLFLRTTDKTGWLHDGTVWNLVFGTEVTAFTANATMVRSPQRIAEVDLAASATLTLPATPIDGDTVYIADVDNSLSPTVQLTISGNGKNVDGAASLLVVTARTTLLLRYNGITWDVLARTPNADVQTFTANGTWVKPGGAKLVQYLVVSGGTGGAGVNASGAATAGAQGTESSLVGASAGSRFYAKPTATVGGAGGVAATIAQPGPGGANSADGEASMLGAKGGVSPLTSTPEQGGGGGGGYGTGGSGGTTSAAGVAGGIGAGGGGAATTTGNGASGGKGGTIVQGIKPAVDVDATMTVTIGTGGAGGVSSFNGGAGGAGIVIVTTLF